MKDIIVVDCISSGVNFIRDILNMGYNPVYVELFTPYSDYAEISVEKTVNLEGTNKNDITEVLEMAVNYGTQQSKTKVSAG